MIQFSSASCVEDWLIGWSVRVFKYVRAQEETILGLRYFISGLLSGTFVHTHFFYKKNILKYVLLQLLRLQSWWQPWLVELTKISRHPNSRVYSPEIIKYSGNYRIGSETSTRGGGGELNLEFINSVTQCKTKIYPRWNLGLTYFHPSSLGEKLD